MASSQVPPQPSATRLSHPMPPPHTHTERGKSLISETNGLFFGLEASMLWAAPFFLNHRHLWILGDSSWAPFYLSILLSAFSSPCPAAGGHTQGLSIPDHSPELQDPFPRVH